MGLDRLGVGPHQAQFGAHAFDVAVDAALVACVRRHAQRRMDTLDLQRNEVVTGPFIELVKGQADFPFELFTTREAHDRPPFLTFDGLIAHTDFVSDLRTVLATLHAAYAHPVEIEFALNFMPDGSYRINLLQCRPMQVRSVEGVTGIEPPADAQQGELF